MVAGAARRPNPTHIDVEGGARDAHAFGAGSPESRDRMRLEYCEYKFFSIIGDSYFYVARTRVYERLVLYLP